MAFTDLEGSLIVAGFVAFLAAIGLLLRTGWKFGMGLRDEMRDKNESVLTDVASRTLAQEAISERLDSAHSKHGQRLGAIEQDIAALNAAPCMSTSEQD